jgi:hypothetical protein
LPANSDSRTTTTNWTPIPANPAAFAEVSFGVPVPRSLPESRKFRPESVPFSGQNLGACEIFRKRTRPRLPNGTRRYLPLI